MKISKLDLLVMGSRNIIQRMSDMEGGQRILDAAETDADVLTLPDTTATRKNLLLNSAFEGFDKDETTPKGWTASGTVAITEAAVELPGLEAVVGTGLGSAAAARALEQGWHVDHALLMA